MLIKLSRVKIHSNQSQKHAAGTKRGKIVCVRVAMAWITKWPKAWYGDKKLNQMRLGLLTLKGKLLFAQ